MLVDSGPVISLEIVVRLCPSRLSRRPRVSSLSFGQPRLFACLPTHSTLDWPQDNFAVEEIESDAVSVESEEDFFDRMAQVGEDAIMAMIEDEIEESRREVSSDSTSLQDDQGGEAASGTAAGQHDHDNAPSPEESDMTGEAAAAAL